MADAPEDDNNSTDATAAELIALNSDHSDFSVLKESYEITGSIEWRSTVSPVILACGCVHYVSIGDTIWFAYDHEEGVNVPVIVEPVTIH